MNSLKEILSKELEVIDFLSEKLFKWQGNPMLLDRTGFTSLSDFVIECSKVTREHLEELL